MNLIRTKTGVVAETAAGHLPLVQIIGVGLNYKAHAAEQNKPAPTRPVLFTKNLASLALDSETIAVPKVCQDQPQVDFEAELAVIIGRPARDVPKEKVFDYVLGYAAANDVSARWWQKEGSGGQFFRGKSFDTFCPLGPRVVAARELDPHALTLSCRVNGQTMQSTPTSDMIFDIAALIADISRGTTLLPGTIILTGTPGGVGMARTPAVYLQDGDTVEVELSGVGVLRNPVRFE